MLEDFLNQSEMPVLEDFLNQSEMPVLEDFLNQSEVPVLEGSCDAQLLHACVIIILLDHDPRSQITKVF